ncbi:MAG: mechanosensitive ion channel family protein [Nocardioidaceae bacterium]
MAEVSWARWLVTLGTTMVGALALIAIVHLVVRMMGHRWQWAVLLERAVKLPFRAFVVVVGVAGVVATEKPAVVDPLLWSHVELVMRLVSIAVGAWLLGAALLYVEDLGLLRYRTDVPDNKAARRMRTQVLILRRLTIAGVVVVAVGAELLSFPGVRALGASVLASAGLVSIVAALAAQSTLANVFAGLQVAFTDAIRLDDVVIVETEWGRIDEITLTYVVVRLWDDRRMVLPSTYFTTTPFQNWTRTSSELLGAVELDLDWRVDIEGLRTELERLVGASILWDGRTQLLQVTDATGGVLRVRALVTARDAGALFDLRCLVREGLATWVRSQDPVGLPRQRVQLVGDEPA